MEVITEAGTDIEMSFVCAFGNTLTVRSPAVTVISERPSEDVGTAETVGSWEGSLCKFYVKN